MFRYVDLRQPRRHINNSLRIICWLVLECSGITDFHSSTRATAILPQLCHKSDSIIDFYPSLACRLHLSRPCPALRLALTVESDAVSVGLEVGGVRAVCVCVCVWLSADYTLTLLSCLSLSPLQVVLYSLSQKVFFCRPVQRDSAEIIIQS